MEKSYYRQQLEKIDSLDKPKLKVDCEHAESAWIDINEQSIDEIIKYFQEVKVILDKPRPFEWKETMKSFQDNPEIPVKIKTKGSYYLEYFTNVLPPLLNNFDDYVLTSEPYDNDKNGKTRFLGIYKSGDVYYGIITTKQKFLQLINSNFIVITIEDAYKLIKLGEVVSQFSSDTDEEVYKNHIITFRTSEALDNLHSSKYNSLIYFTK